MNDLSYKQILVGQHLSGMKGLLEIFAQLRAAGEEPSEVLGAELLERAKEYNYIPSSAAEEYRQALLREYRTYLTQQANGAADNCKTTSATWNGIPREQITWYPSVYPGDCNGCKKCFEFCPYGVYEWDAENAVPIVVNPFNCRVGCSMCALRCPCTCIHFPPQQLLDELLKPLIASGAREVIQEKRG